MMMRKTCIALVSALSLIIGIAGHLAAYPKQDIYQQGATYLNIRKQIIENYVEEVDTEELYIGALNGLIASSDPYGRFVPAGWSNDGMLTSVDAAETLGLKLTVDRGIVTVVSPIEGSAAFEAGFLPGDRIVKFGEDSVREMSIYDCIDRFDAAEDELMVTVFRRGESVSTELPFQKEARDILPVVGHRKARGKWRYTLEPDNDVGYVRIVELTDSAAGRLHEEVDRLVRRGVDAFVLDLRHCVGPSVKAALDIADMFVRKGTLVTGRGRGGDVLIAPKAKSGDPFEDVLLVILVDGGTGGAAEVLASAIRDNRPAVVVGSRSFGDGNQQSLFDVGDDVGSQVLLTSVRFYAPSGRALDRSIYRYTNRRMPTSNNKKEPDPVGCEPDFAIQVTNAEQLEWQRSRIRAWADEELPSADEEEVEETDTEAPEEVFEDRVLERAVMLLKGLKVYRQGKQK